jgi:predicted transcriptional regulator YdeE
MPHYVDFAKPLRIAGMTARTTNSRESNPTTASLPGLWGRFYSAKPPADNTARDNGGVYSVYTEYESDVNGAYSVVIGREQSDPTAEKVVTIPAGRYLEFTSTGAMPAAVVNGWKQVWSYFAEANAPKRAYTTDFEYYDPSDPSTVKIYVAVAR